ncbi:MAG: MBL fold metallo-hydrolase [Thermodesulfobacteriota bacterium]|jgi:glyoxylase-like metal-dependent hydrolase (beta-lactamase superfamily II)|nr:MAG: MBL fold metallo-hydrolase [Thermodesulfobacteriota bacterium]
MYIRQYQINNFAVFSYLVGCKKTKEAVVIDPAGDVEIILQDAAKDNFRITKIINTHGHIDHIMGNADLKKKTNAAIIIHEADAHFLSADFFSNLMMFDAQPSPSPDVLVKDGDTISFGEEELRVIHTPGHSQGSMCLYAEGYIFTGDTLFVEGVGRTDFPGSSWAKLLHSITKKLFSLPDETVVFPGHNYGFRPTSTIGDEKRNNPFVKGEDF